MESGRALGCTTAVMYLGTRSEENTHIMVALSLVLFIDISGKSITFPRQTYTFDLIWPDFGEYYFSNSLLLYFSEGTQEKSKYGMISDTMYLVCEGNKKIQIWHDVRYQMYLVCDSLGRFLFGLLYIVQISTPTQRTGPVSDHPPPRPLRPPPRFLDTHGL